MNEEICPKAISLLSITCSFFGPACGNIGSQNSFTMSGCMKQEVVPQSIIACPLNGLAVKEQYLFEEVAISDAENSMLNCALFDNVTERISISKLLLLICPKLCFAYSSGILFFQLCQFCVATQSFVFWAQRLQWVGLWILGELTG